MDGQVKHMAMPDTHQGSNFVQHASCEKCGSSDGVGVFDDQHGYCFVCSHYYETYGEPDGTAGETTSIPATGSPKQKALLQGEAQAIPGRKLNKAICAKYGYLVGEYQGEACQIAVYRDEAGNPVAQKVRRAGKQFQIVGDGKKLRLWGAHLWNKGKRIVLTEGEIDCLAVAQANNNGAWPVVSIPNGAPAAARAVRDNWTYLEQFDEIIIMFDQDAAGRAAAQEVAELLPVGKAKIAHLPMKDASDCLVAGQEKAIIEAMFQAKPHQPDGIVSVGELRDVIAIDDAAGAVEWPYSQLDSILRGIRPAEMTCIVSGTGQGKSTFTKELIHHLLMNDQKVGVLALEEANKRTALALVGVHMNRNIVVDRSLATDEEVVEAFDDLFTDRTCVLYDSWGSNQIDTICQRLMWMCRSHGITHAVLDHISLLVSGNEGDDRKNLDVAATKLRTLCQETGLHLFTVSHLKRPDGRGHEDGGAVSLSQVRGSTAIAGLSDTVLGLQKDPDDPDSDLRVLRVLKNRYTGETGFAGNLVYNRQTGRLLEEELALLEAEIEDEPETAEGENNESSE